MNLKPIIQLIALRRNDKTVLSKGQYSIMTSKLHKTLVDPSKYSEMKRKLTEVGTADGINLHATSLIQNNASE